MEIKNLEKKCFLCRSVVESVSDERQNNICTSCPPGSDTIYYCCDEHLSAHRGKSHQNRNRKSTAQQTNPSKSNQNKEKIAPTYNDMKPLNAIEPDAVCWPFCIETRPSVGRIMMATRDIRAGETILEEAPAVWGPNDKSPAVCLGCLKPAVKVDSSNAETSNGNLPSTINKCSKCRFPVCGSECK